jgi:AraC-like DNA-binding protein
MGIHGCFTDGESSTPRHCEVRSNLYAMQSEPAYPLCLRRDCFVPRNDDSGTLMGILRTSVCSSTAFKSSLPERFRRNLFTYKNTKNHSLYPCTNSGIARKNQKRLSSTYLNVSINSASFVGACNQHTMDNYFRYFPTSERDELWGVTVLNAGCTQIERSSNYPPAHHPSHYNFSRDKGRVLQEYQLIYITKGSGFFESSGSKKHKITAGSMILLFPGEMHRYRPDADTGWDEYWVGFKGGMIDDMITHQFFNPESPVFHIGFNETIMNLFMDIIRLSKEEKVGYQPAISGAVIYLLGQLYSADKQTTLHEKDLVELTVSKARVIFRSKIYDDITPEKAAEELQVGYSWFRKVFKKYTGIAPGQYIIQLKIQKAKELLSDPAKSVKEVAYDLQFESALYFSKVFKEKAGLTPVAYREQLLGKG